MLAAVITRPGDPDVLEIQERPTPVPGAEQVLVRVRASSLNRADLAQRRGRYPAPPGAPADIPGLEYAGEVVALGPEVRDRRVGDRVMGLVGGGGHAEYVVVHERTTMGVPEAMRWTDAGAIPEAFMTAHDALVQADLRPGETVLVHAVGSGVGLAAVQLVRAGGGRALGTARTPSKLEQARAHGMLAGLAVLPDVARDPATLRDALVAFVHAHTEERPPERRGADVALDLAGGTYVNATLHALAPMGRAILIGLVAGARDTVDLDRVLRGRLTLRGTVMRARALEERIATARRFAAEALPLFGAGALRATVDAVFPLARIAEAHALLESNATTGKVVLTLD